MRYRYGFSLLELLLYLGASSIICTLLCSWVVHAVCATHRIHLQNTVDIALLTILDCCSRDIYAAPTQSKAWIKQEPQSVVWVQGDMATGYCYDKKRLMRISGKYDPIAKVLIGKLKRSKIASHVTKCQFMIQKKQQTIIGVDIECAIQKGDIQGECSHSISIQNS